MTSSTLKLKAIDRRETLRYLQSGRAAEEDRKQPEDKEKPAGGLASAAAFERLLADCEAKLISAVTARYVFQDFPLDRPDGGETGVALAGFGLTLGGRDIAAHLAGCERAVLLAATLGGAPDKLIRLSQIDDMAGAVVYDALASAAVEQVLDEAEAAVGAAFPDHFLTWRFSPGYGDFPLRLQTDILTLLDAPRKIGLTATPGFLLTPVKSVTAVLGVSRRPIERRRRGCAGCNLSETCRFRREGGRCR